MATLLHFPSFHSLSPRKLSLSLHFPTYPCLNRLHNHCYSTISASSLKKPHRGGRKAKSDEDLRNDIKDFLSIVGLPQDHVPTTNELSSYGRRDLANIVRRRGYKHIRQLLETSSSTANLIESEANPEMLAENEKQKQLVGVVSNENEADIMQLRLLMHETELELSQLMEQIQKEKFALSVMQSKAAEEEFMAELLVSEKETELLEAEEALSGLKEVEIQYYGDGGIVELAGSFNGWNPRIPMEPEFLRTRRIWRTTLWLYPGVYEMKFVVDGHWIVHSGMETITRNRAHNNVLRVDR